MTVADVGFTPIGLAVVALLRRGGLTEAETSQRKGIGFRS
jgi:hypothetical protein